MPRKETEPLRRCHIYLFDQDYDEITALFGGNIGESKAIRHMIRKYLRMIKDRTQEQSKPMERGDDKLITGIIESAGSGE